MAAGTKLELTFLKADGSKTVFTYNYANPEASSNSVKALMNGMITNGSIFENVPAVIDSAKLVTTSETSLRVSE